MVSPNNNDDSRGGGDGTPNKTANQNDNNVNSNIQPADRDIEFMKQADEKIKQEQYLEAARLLRQVQNKSSSMFANNKLMYEECLQVAEEFERAMNDLMQPTPEQDGWTKQTEQHGRNKFDTAIYYKVDNQTHQLTCLMEAAIPSSLLVPLLSIMNECALYGTWMPSWKRPFRVGYRKTEVLKEMGRGHLINHVVVDLPPPYHARDLILHARAIDEIESSSAESSSSSSSSSSKIVIRAKSLQSSKDDPCVPDPGKHVVRMDMDSTFVFQPCPPNHPLLQQHSKMDHGTKNTTDNNDEKMLLFLVKQRVDAHVSFVPLSIINFFTRQFLSSLLNSFLTVGQEIRDGKRPDHQAAIQSKPELYEWVQSRAQVMFDRLQKQQEQQQSPQTTELPKNNEEKSDGGGEQKEEGGTESETDIEEESMRT